MNKPVKYSAEVRERAVRMVLEHQGQRWQRDRSVETAINRVWNENRQGYGVRKVWRHLLCEGWLVECCTVARLMHKLGLRGVIRGNGTQTTVSEKARPCPLDKVNRQFHADRPIDSALK